MTVEKIRATKTRSEVELTWKEKAKAFVQGHIELTINAFLHLGFDWKALDDPLYYYKKNKGYLKDAKRLETVEVQPRE